MEMSGGCIILGFKKGGRGLKRLVRDMWGGSLGFRSSLKGNGTQDGFL